MDGYPTKLIDNENKEWSLLRVSDDGTLSYKTENMRCAMGLYPAMVERDFSKKGRPEPEHSVIMQGKYECYPAAIANVIGEKLFHVKRAFAAAGWRNDNTGATDEMAVAALNKLGLYAGVINIAAYDLAFETGAPDLNTSKCVMFRPSLNIKGASHAIGYNGKQTIDPNWGYEGRKFWGTEWKPRTIGCKRLLLLVDDMEDQKALERLEELRLDAIKQRALEQLNF